jgi:hypothetical protein
MKTFTLTAIVLLIFNQGFSQENSYRKKISFIEEVKKFPTLLSESIEIQEVEEHEIVNTLALASSLNTPFVSTEKVEAKAIPAHKKRSKKTVKLKTI